MAAVHAHRQAFVAGRGALAHRDFCSLVGVGHDLDPWVVCVRRAVARLLQVPPAALRPGDTWKDLRPLQAGGWDDLGVIFSLEAVGVEFPTNEAEEIPRFVPGRLFWMRWPAPESFGDWAGTTAAHLASHGCRLDRHRAGQRRHP